MALKWHIAIGIEPEREWEGYIVASNVQTAVFLAIDQARLQEGELLHMIHVGPPKEDA